MWPWLAEEDSNMMAKPWIENFSAGYIQRSLDLMPKQGKKILGEILRTTLWIRK